ncbi:plasmid pRiA4b ORF-3 family protein [Salicibibacter cibi]|uniref:Plasmid pRiA4b ORF-3 family protein n=1 Tax=Salicibibacter cibi TaxID=2743001 RepID=A0A7T6Z980_9BACI|nr:plasmid pRiA4b ORF-3 family protein [Salicibibacter cibi]QQK79032.1 plasmid pRiA4b ORF-3 family protein [Salicibibacter cibi]
MEEINTTLNEFETFMRYIEKERPLLSQKHGVLGKKDAFRLNASLNYKREVKGPHYTQAQYPEIDLMFFLATAGKLYAKGNNERGKPVLIETDAMKEFKTLNPYEKYVYLTQIYWSKYGFNERTEKYVSLVRFYDQLESIHHVDLGEKIPEPDSYFYVEWQDKGVTFFHHLRFFGFGEFEETSDFGEPMQFFIPNQWGINMSGLLIEHTVKFWNGDGLERLLRSLRKRKDRVKKEPFDVFKKIFPARKVQNTVTSEGKIDRSGMYTFKVILWKHCWRKIIASHEHTFEELHHAIQDAFQFDDDHLYSFYINGNKETGQPIFCAFMDNDKGYAADKTTIADVGLFKGQKLYYLFDFGDEWHFEINLSKIDKQSPLPEHPTIIEEEGEAPDQYNTWTALF